MKKDLRFLSSKFTVSKIFLLSQGLEAGACDRQLVNDLVDLRSLFHHIVPEVLILGFLEPQTFIE